MAKAAFPHPGHEKHLCYLVNMRLQETNMKAYIPLVNEGKYVCKHCGRVANEKTSLCKPVAL